MTEKCGAIGALTVGGRVVGSIRCELDAGHDSPSRCTCGCYGTIGPIPHAVTLTWTPEAAPDLDLFDPAEHFDVEIPEPELRCGQCAGVIIDVATPGDFAPSFVHRDSTPATRSHSVQW